MSQSAGLVMHIHNRLNANTRREVEASIMHRPGITSAQFSDKRPHFMVIEYDPLSHLQGGYFFVRPRSDV